MKRKREEEEGKIYSPINIKKKKISNINSFRLLGINSFSSPSQSKEPDDSKSIVVPKISPLTERVKKINENLNQEQDDNSNQEGSKKNEIMTNNSELLNEDDNEILSMLNQLKSLPEIEEEGQEPEELIHVKVKNEVSDLTKKDEELEYINDSGQFDDDDEEIETEKKSDEKEEGQIKGENDVSTQTCFSRKSSSEIVEKKNEEIKELQKKIEKLESEKKGNEKMLLDIEKNTFEIFNMVNIEYQEQQREMNRNRNGNNIGQNRNMYNQPSFPQQPQRMRPNMNFNRNRNLYNNKNNYNNKGYM